MANANRPSGLSPVKYLNGSMWTGQATQYCIPSTDSTYAYAIGDPVDIAGGADGNGVPTVVLATAGITNPILGAIVATSSVPFGSANAAVLNNLNTTIIPIVKASNYYVLVTDDPNVIYEIQEVGGGTQLTAAEVGLNAPLIAGANNGYISGWMLNNVGEVVTATEQVRLLGLAQRRDNAFGAYAKWLVLINNHRFRIGQVGA